MAQIAPLVLSCIEQGLNIGDIQDKIKGLGLIDFLGSDSEKIHAVNLDNGAIFIARSSLGAAVADFILSLDKSEILSKSDIVFANIFDQGRSYVISDNPAVAHFPCRLETVLYGNLDSILMDNHIDESK